MSLVQRLTRCLRLTRPQPRPRRPQRCWVDDELPAPADDEDLPPRGCGWFDSSHELRQGLAISEHAADEVLASLPLGDWLDWQSRSRSGKPSLAG